MPCFAVDHTSLWLAYEEIAAAYPGWRLADVRALTVSERRYFLDSAYWRAERLARG